MNTKSNKATLVSTPMLVSQMKPSKVTWSIIMSALSAAKQKKATSWVLREIKKQDSVDVETSLSLRDDLYEMVSRFSSVGNSPEPFRAMLDQLVKLYKAEMGNTSIKPVQSVKDAAKSIKVKAQAALKSALEEAQGYRDHHMVPPSPVEARIRDARALLKAKKTVASGTELSSDLNKKVTSALVSGALAAQQGHFMTERGLTKFKVEPKVLRRFARLAFKAFRVNLKQCKTERDHDRLHKALVRKLRVDGRGFLKAKYMVEIKSA